MRLVSIFLFLVFLSSRVIGQNAPLPEILVPSDVAKAEAAHLDAHVFKILPRFLLTKEMATHKDDEYPLGIRESGAYYSFTTRSHSYNRIPQIGLEGGHINAGAFGGLSYGLMKDLGQISLEDVRLDHPETSFLATYLPRNLVPEIRAEQAKRGNYKANGYVYRSHLPAVVGNSYILRAIDYHHEADLLVRFKILRKLEDGSLEIAWRELKSFPAPIPWYSTDQEMTEKLGDILAREKFVGVSGEVKDNVITIRGTLSQRNLSDLKATIHYLRPVKVNYEVTNAK